ncbi:hypothetical protein [Pseudomonas koreensis]|uniref:hypothetical protein n=1 Tax=Pseudomonas koreensis TaxID=198620 RepID=UPI001411ED93|nr:hypothetical protein [Pseudomonas koreensis]NHX01178.1 hypothetical protein [Pseudomonas koreensis]
MSNEITVRSLMVGADKKYIKAINEVSLVDYLRITTTQNTNTLYDFSIVVDNFHTLLNKKANQIQAKGLSVNRHTIFNTWSRFRTTSNKEQKNGFSTALVIEAEKAMNSIKHSLTDLKNSYLWARDEINHYPQTYKKSEAFEEYALNIECYTEALLCSFHTTAISNLESFKEDTTLIEHAYFVRDSLTSCLYSETGFFNESFQSNSLIYQCCMENMGIDVPALLLLMDCKISKSDLKEKIYDNEQLDTHYDYNIPYRKLTLEWPEADLAALKRTKRLASLLQNINSIISKMEELKAENFELTQTPTEQEQFIKQIEELIQH